MIQRLEARSQKGSKQDARYKKPEKKNLLGEMLLASGFWLLASGFWLLASGISLYESRTTNDEPRFLKVGGEPCAGVS